MSDDPQLRFFSSLSLSLSRAILLTPVTSHSWDSQKRSAYLRFFQLYFLSNFRERVGDSGIHRIWKETSTRDASVPKEKFTKRKLIWARWTAHAWTAEPDGELYITNFQKHNGSNPFGVQDTSAPPVRRKRLFVRLAGDVSRLHNRQTKKKIRYPLSCQHLKAACCWMDRLSFFPQLFSIWERSTKL